MPQQQSILEQRDYLNAAKIIPTKAPNEAIKPKIKLSLKPVGLSIIYYKSIF